MRWDINKHKGTFGEGLDYGGLNPSLEEGLS